MTTRHRGMIRVVKLLLVAACVAAGLLFVKPIPMYESVQCTQTGPQTAICMGTLDDGKRVQISP